jgi:hypothetical protein
MTARAPQRRPVVRAHACDDSPHRRQTTTMRRDLTREPPWWLPNLGLS